MSGSIRTAYCTTFRSRWFEAHLMTAGVHRHPCIITVNRENGTFIIHETDDDGRFIPYTAKPVNTAQDESLSNESSDVSTEDESKPPVTGAANTTAVLLITVATVLFVVSRKKES